MHDCAAATAALRTAAATWATGEAQAMQQAGLAVWSRNGDDSYARWQIPLQARHDTLEAHLTIEETYWDGLVWPCRRLVWQLTVFTRDSMEETTRQAEIAKLGAGSMTSEDLMDAIDSLLSIGPDEVLEWTREVLAVLGLSHRLQER